MRGFLKFLLFVGILAVPGYFYLVLHSPAPGTPYRLDLNQVRALAASVPGPRAREVRVERIAELRFAEAMVMAGEPWRWTPIPVYAYQLAFPGRSIVVDAAMDGVADMPGFLVNDYSTEAFGRLKDAMGRADQIVVTHEHFDHIGGIFTHPDLAALLPALRLTTEQLSHPAHMRPLSPPPLLLADYTPLRYEGMHALAPGVVLIKAPGHTPGSQMVYVQKADGTELLLLGDVSWQMRNIHAVRERPLFITALIRENREQVIEQFNTLNGLLFSHPELHLVPGHDALVMEQLLAEGVLVEGF
mgnify:CR=1 FL=1